MLLSENIERKFIDQRNINDYEVLTDTGWASINKSLKTIEYEVYNLQTENFNLRCADTHIVFDHNLNEIFVKDLIPGAKIFTASGLETVIEIENTQVNENMYDLQLENSSNSRYFTNGILSHNTGVGKTIYLCHFAADLITNGYNVLYVTGEMDENLIAKRIDANMLDVNMDDFNVDLERKPYLKKIRNLYDKVSGRLKIKEYSAGACNALHLKTLLQEYELKNHFKPDVVLLDYINLFSSFRLPASAMANSYLYVKSVVEEMRGLAREHNLACVTATQTNRGGADAGTETSMEDTSECLDPNTELIKIDNSKIKLKDIQVGDKILAHDGQKTVMMVHHPKMKKSFRIKTKSGKEIICSPDHKFPSSNGRISINEGLKIGDKLFTSK